MRPTITIDQASIDRIKREFLLMDAEVPVALSRAINRAVDGVNTEGSVQVRKYYNLTASRVKQNFSVRKSTRSNLQAQWQSKGEPVGLIRFGPRQNRTGVSVQVLKSNPRKTVRSAWIMLGLNNQDHIWRREKNNGVMVSRYPIKRLTGPRIEDALSKPDAQKALQNKADTVLIDRLNHEANYILSKAR